MFDVELHLIAMHSTDGGRAEYKLAKDYSYITRYGTEIVVPAGFITDLASIPRPFWFLIPPGGNHSPAAVVHDFLCRIGEYREYADSIFLDALKECGVGYLRRYAMYAAVRAYAIVKGL